MIFDGEYRLSGLIPLRDAAPCFATPLFVKAGSNGEYMQDVDRDMNLFGMIEPKLPASPRPIRDIPNRKVEFSGKPYLAFVPLGPAPIFGTRDEIVDRLRQEAQRLSAFPYIQRSIARFLADGNLIREADANIRAKRARRTVTLATPVFPTVHISTSVYRLTSEFMSIQFDHHSPGTSDADLGDLALQSTSWAGFEAPTEQKAQLETLLSGTFRYATPMGSRFAYPNTSGFYAATSISGAVAEAAWYRARLFQSLGHHKREVQRLLVTEWTLDADLADLRATDFAIDDYSQSQWIGEHFRSSGVPGLIYNPPYPGAYSAVFLFNPKPIRAGRIIGTMDLLVDEKGGASYTMDPK